MTEAPDPLTTVTRMVIRPDSVELRDTDDQLVGRLDYMGQADEAVATLTTVFRMAPRDDAYPGSNHFPSGVHHSWGDLVLDERQYDETRRDAENLDYLVWPRFAVYFDGPTAHGIDLVSAQRHQAGDDWSAVSNDPEFDPGQRTCVGTALEVMEFVSPKGNPESVAVVVTRSDVDTVQWIGAPEMIADGCA